MNIVYFVEKNIYGAWVVYGIDGIKHYYDCSKEEAIKKYKEDCNVFINQPWRGKEE